MSETATSTSLIDSPTATYNYMSGVFLDPIIIGIVSVIIIGYFVHSYSLGKNSVTGETESSFGQTFFGIIVILILLVLIGVNVAQYFFDINISSYVENIFSNRPKVNIFYDHPVGSDEANRIANSSKSKDQLPGQSDYVPAPVPTIKYKKQVFNVPGNYYTYKDAKALCISYGSKLANYKQLEDAYEKGAEWNNYGWSDGQNAFFPTQQKTFDNLQKIKGHEHDLGRPGINGGYIANPEVKFGANCYGNKPKIRPREENLMKTHSPYPQTLEDQEFQKRVDFWKTKIDKILVSPFNYNSWS